MRFVVFALAAYTAAVLQTSLVPALEVRHVMPDVFALVAILWQLTVARSGVDRAVALTPGHFIAAALVGLAYDLTSSGPLGIGAGLFAAVGYAIAWIRAKLDFDHPLMRLAIVFFATAAIAAVETLIWRLRGDTGLSWPTLIVRAASVGVYTTGFAVPIVMVLGWFRTKPLVEANL
jgi:rod shape-determining protein MreD